MKAFRGALSPMGPDVSMTLLYVNVLLSLVSEDTAGFLSK